MKNIDKIRNDEVVKVNRKWLYTMAEAIQTLANEVAKHGNAPMWTNTTPAEAINNIAEAFQKEACRE